MTLHSTHRQLSDTEFFVEAAAPMAAVISNQEARRLADSHPGEVPSMRIIVQKFGGTAVATADGRRQVAERVRQTVASGLSAVVVVSAMGRAGDPYATDTFLKLAQDIYPDTAPRELDMLIGCGELISAVIMCNTLKAHGLDAVALTGGQAGIVTDAQFGEAQILRVNPEHTLRHLREGKVVVVAGFQGWTENGDIATLGRGGSDTSAAALGAALRAEVVEIYTDVDGLKTADPRIVPDARTIPVTTYDEIVNLAYHGAKVIHPRAVEIAMRRNIPLRIRNTFDDSPGTLVTYSIEASFAEAGERAGRRLISGVTHLPGVAQVRARHPDGESGTAVQLKVFRALADANISIDLINVSSTEKTFIVNETQVEKACRVLRGLGLDVETVPDCARISIVGSRIHGQPGILALMVEALADAGVTMLQTSDSHVTVSCLVRRRDMERAVRALHERFGLGGKGTEH